MKKLASLTIFFPFLNDQGTVERQIENAYLYGKKYTKDLEVIAIHGGKSSDKTKQEILRMKKKFPSLVVINKENNVEGYAVIKYGFLAAKKDWIFYTDGDAQYHLENDLIRLIERQLHSNADIVNAYKKSRHDNIIRVILGDIYKKISRIIFNLPVRDVDCDFRLIRKDVIKKITLESSDASILPELIIKLKQARARFAEIPVKHYPRVYGKSNYTAISLMREKIIGDFLLYLKLKRMKNAYKSLNKHLV